MSHQTPGVPNTKQTAAENQNLEGPQVARPRHRRPAFWRLAGLALLIAVGAFLLMRFALLSVDQATSSEPSDIVGFPLRTQVPAPLPIPPTVAGLSLRAHLFGQDAADEINRLHRGNFRLTGAAVALYGDAAATVWIGGTQDVSRASLITSQMTKSIARSNNPFTPVGERQLRGIDVYELTGMGQIHYYFQVGNRIYWLAVEPYLADQGLSDLLDFALDAD